MIDAMELAEAFQDVRQDWTPDRCRLMAATCIRNPLVARSEHYWATRYGGDFQADATLAALLAPLCEDT